MVSLSIAADHAIFLHGLKRLLDGEPDFEVLSASRSGRDALRESREK
ncbi:MAG: hypothetical protein OEW15_02835 [Nitrospirota bacterium]|nr:hypothetical protein [Nitrospirota bacterium]